MSSTKLHLRVTSIATNVPGPVAAARLHELGAAVTKVEPPGGDYLALAARSWYDELCEGQTVLTLDLKAPSERDSFEQLLAESDVLITSSRPSALQRLGLASESLLERHPRLCIVSIIGYAAPHAERAGHDLTYQAEAGLVVPPAMPASLFVDLSVGEAAVSAALALVVERSRTGRGGAAQVAMDVVARRLADPRRHGLTARGRSGGEGVLGGALPTYSLYAASDGTIAVAALEAHFAARLVAGLGLEEASTESFARAFASRTTQEWDTWARANDIPLAAVSDP